MNEEEIHICKEHNLNITHVQQQPNGVNIGLCVKCFDQIKIMPINQASQIAQQTRERQITIVKRAENTDSKELMKMLKTFKNLKQLLQEKIDEIIKVIEEGQKKLKNEFSSQMGNLSTQLNIFSHIEVMQTGEVFKNVKEEIQSYVKKYNDELIQLVKAVIENGMANTQTISVPPQHEIQQPSSQINQQPPQEIQQSPQQPQIQQPQIIQQPPQLQPEITKSKIRLISQAPVNLQQPPQESQAFFQQPIQQTQNQSLQFLQISQTPQQQFNLQQQQLSSQQQQAMIQSQGIQFQPPQQEVQSPDPMQPQNGFSQQPLLRSQSFSQEIHQTNRQSSKIRFLTSTTQIQKEFKYEFRSQLRVDQCNSMVIGMNDKYFINGLNTEIQIWKFNNGELSQPINIKGNNSQVVCLCFSKKSNWLISGFYDGTMKIWQQQENGDWNCIQKLNSLKNVVKSIVLTPQEDQFLSFSDQSIQVWMKNQINEWDCFQIVTETAVQLLFLSLSPNYNLASTDHDGRLIIWQRQQSNMWQEKQVIENPYNDKYIRICFVEDNELIATTENEGKLIQFQEQNGQFRQVAEYPQKTPQKEQISSVFPIVYNNQFKVAIVRHNNYVLIFVKSSNGQFIQKSDIQGNFWSGDLTSDCKFLFMWEKENKSIFVMESV